MTSTRALRHAVREFLNGDRLGKDHLAQNLFLLLHLTAEQPLLPALERGDGARALFVGSGGGGGDRQTAAILHRAAARGRRARRLGRRKAADGAHRRTTHRGFALGANGGARRGRTRRGSPDGRTARRRNAGGVSRQPATRLFLGLALRLGFARETLFFLALARVGGGALCAFALLAFGARLGVDFGAAAIFLFARFRVDQRAGARFALLVGQRAQHDAGAGARRGRRDVGSRISARPSAAAPAAPQSGPSRRPASPARPVRARDASPSRPRPLSSGHGRSSDAPCHARPVAALGATSSTARRSEFCRRCSRLHSSSSQSWVATTR